MHKKGPLPSSRRKLVAGLSGIDPNVRFTGWRYLRALSRQPLCAVVIVAQLADRSMAVFVVVAEDSGAQGPARERFIGILRWFGGPEWTAEQVHPCCSQASNGMRAMYSDPFCRQESGYPPPNCCFSHIFSGRFRVDSMVSHTSVFPPGRSRTFLVQLRMEYA